MEGDLAQFMVRNKFTTAEEVVEKAADLDFPNSVVDYFEGNLGQPVGGFPEPLRSRVLRGKPTKTGRPGAEMAAFDFGDTRATLSLKYRDISAADVMSYAMYPDVAEHYFQTREKYGDLSVLPTREFLYPMEDDSEVTFRLDQGKDLSIRLATVGRKVNSKGEREVYFRLNGAPRTLMVVDENEKAVERRPKATGQPGMPILNVSRSAASQCLMSSGSVGSPMPGVVIRVRVAEGDVVTKGTPLLVLSAMKMETVVSAPMNGKIEQLFAIEGDSLAAGDLCVTMVA